MGRGMATACLGLAVLLAAMAEGAGQTKSKDKPAAKADKQKPSAPAPTGMVLRARVLGGKLGPAALLEVDGRLHFVREGMTLPAAGGATLRVVEISSSHVGLETEPDKKSFVLR